MYILKLSFKIAFKIVLKMILLIITIRQSFRYFYMQSTAVVYERRGVELHRLTSPVTTVIICKFDTDG